MSLVFEGLHHPGVIYGPGAANLFHMTLTCGLHPLGQVTWYSLQPSLHYRLLPSHSCSLFSTAVDTSHVNLEFYSGRAMGLLGVIQTCSATLRRNQTLENKASSLQPGELRKATVYHSCNLGWRDGKYLHAFPQNPRPPATILHALPCFRRQIKSLDFLGERMLGLTLIEHFLCASCYVTMVSFNCHKSPTAQVPSTPPPFPQSHLVHLLDGLLKITRVSSRHSI